MFKSYMVLKFESTICVFKLFPSFSIRREFGGVTSVYFFWSHKTRATSFSETMETSRPFEARFKAYRDEQVEKYV